MKGKPLKKPIQIHHYDPEKETQICETVKPNFIFYFYMIKVKNILLN